MIFLDASSSSACCIALVLDWIFFISKSSLESKSASWSMQILMQSDVSETDADEASHAVSNVKLRRSSISTLVVICLTCELPGCNLHPPFVNTLVMGRYTNATIQTFKLI